MINVSIAEILGPVWVENHIYNFIGNFENFQIKPKNLQ